MEIAKPAMELELDPDEHCEESDAPESDEGEYSDSAWSTATGSTRSPGIQKSS